MNPHHHWDKHSPVYKAVHKWVKHGVASSKIAKEELFYKYSCVLPSSLKGTAQWDDVVDGQVTADLEGLRLLNWCPMATQLHAIKLPQDKLSFSHSVSVSLWGVPDNKGLVNFLIKTTLKLHHRVWESRLRQNTAHNPRIEDMKSDSGRLLPGHIFILSNVLQRPIIIVSDEENGMHFGAKEDVAHYFGIYLPLMSKPIDCAKTPIFLAYLRGHFFPLVVEVHNEESNGALADRYSVIFPLVKSDYGMFPVKYLQDSEEMRAGEILQDYLIVKETDMASDDGLCRLVFTQSQCYTLPEDKNVIFDYMKTPIQFYDQKTKNQKSTLLQRFKKPFRPSAINVGHHPVGTQASGQQQFTGAENHQLNVQNFEFAARTGFMSNQNGIVDVTNKQLIRAEPNAPAMIEGTVEPMSMTNERCISCKSYRSSIYIFPYCHECYERKNKMEEEQALRENSANDPQLNNIPTDLLSVSDQHEALNISSMRNSNDDKESPALNGTGMRKEGLIDREREALSHTDLPIVGELSDNNFVEVEVSSFRSSFDQKNVAKDTPKVCASPVCKEEISSSEMICQKCIKILKIHHLSNCSKACCNSNSPTQDVKTNDNNSDCAMSGNQNIEIQPNGLTNVSSRKQPIEEMEKKYQSSAPGDNNMRESPNPDNCSIQRIISVPENDTKDVTDPFGTSSLSLMVTNLTSLDERNPVNDHLSGPNVSLIHNHLQDEEERLVVRYEDTKYRPNVSNFWARNNESFSNVHNSGGERQNLILDTKMDEFKPDEYQYQQTMADLEHYLKKEVSKCKSHFCSNYGSKERYGYCNKCYREKYTHYHHGHHCHSNGVDECDGVGGNGMMDEDEDYVDGQIPVTDSGVWQHANQVDGQIASKDSPYYNNERMQNSSSSDSSDFLLTESESSEG